MSRKFNVKKKYFSWPVVRLEAALFLSFLLVFVQWELDESGSRLPEYAAACVPAFLLIFASPQLALGFLVRLPAVVIPLAAVLIHAAVIVPVNDPRYFFGLFCMAISVVVMTSIYALKPNIFVRVLWAFIAFIVGSFFLQLLLYLMFGELVDIHNWLYPTSISRGAENFLNVTRLTGLHVEPGNYAVSTTLLLLCLRIISGRFDWLAYVALVTIIGTYAVEGFIVGVIVAVWMIFDRIRSGHGFDYLGIVVMSVSLIGIAIALDLQGYLETRFLTRVDESAVTKEIPFVEFSNLLPAEKLVGIGFGNRVCADCSMDGAGFGANLLMKGGALSLFALLVFSWVCLFRRRVPIVAMAMIYAVIVIAKFPVTVPTVWLVLGLLGVSSPKPTDDRPVRLAAGSRNLDWYVGSSGRIAAHPISKDE